MACNCYTTWGTRVFTCSYCWFLDDASRNAILLKINEFTDEIAAELSGKVRGSINLQTFWQRRPGPPGTSGPTFRLVSRYCMTNDWYAFRNLSIASALDGNTGYDLAAPVDCTNLVPCDDGDHWLGYWWIKNTTCGCVGPVPSTQSGVFVGPMTVLQVMDNLNQIRTVSRSLMVEARWEEQTCSQGAAGCCGSTVPAGQTPPQPPGGYWYPKNKFKFYDLILKYVRKDTKWQQEIENTVDHTCPR